MHCAPLSVPGTDHLVKCRQRMNCTDASLLRLHLQSRLLAEPQLVIGRGVVAKQYLCAAVSINDGDQAGTPDTKEVAE
ncbi:hypothetical protein D9M69_545930 [compost metagenome]